MISTLKLHITLKWSFKFWWVFMWSVTKMLFIYVSWNMKSSSSLKRMTASCWKFQQQPHMVICKMLCHSHLTSALALLYMGAEFLHFNMKCLTRTSFAAGQCGNYCVMVNVTASVFSAILISHYVFIQVIYFFSIFKIINTAILYSSTGTVNLNLGWFQLKRLIINHVQL